MTWGVQNKESEAHQQLSYALQDMGLNFIDTAEIYPVPPRYATSQSPTLKYAVTLRAEEYIRCTHLDNTETSEILQRGDSGADRPFHLNMAQSPKAGRPSVSYKGVSLSPQIP